MTNPFAKFAQAINPFAQFAQSAPKAPTAIATTRDGGQVFRLSNGQLSFKSPGYATNDQEAIARIMEGATPLQEAQRTTDQLTVAQAPIAARLQEFNQGAPLIGEYLDEAVGMVSPKAGRAMDQLSDAFERTNPVQAGALNVAGAITTTLPLLAGRAGQMGADFIARGTGYLNKGLRAAAVAAPAGAVETAAAFSGRADSGERLGAAGTGAVVGGTLAAVLAPLAPALGEGVAWMARRVKKLDVKAIAEEFGISAPAARVVKGYLMNDDLDAAAKVLARGGDDAMLASSGPATRQGLDTAMSTGGAALSVARGRVDEATQKAGGRLQSAINDILGTAEGGIKAASRRIAESTKTARKAAYDFAYSRPTPMTGEAAGEIDGVLARISPDDMRAALKEASAEMLDSGYTNQNIMASIADDGKVTFSQPLSVLQLDYLARGLSNVVEAGTDTLTGAQSPAARRAAGQIRDLRNVLKEAVPGYATALKLGGDTARQREALAMGRKLLTENATVEDVRNFLKEGVSDEVKAAVRKGLRENLDAIMGRARTTIADLEAGNLDFDTGVNAVGESVAAVRNLLNRNNMTKTRFALGSDAKRLFGELEKMGDALVLRAAVARSTATAIRTAGQQQMADEVAPGVVRRVAGNMGNPLEAARDLTQTAVGIDARSLSDAQRGYYAEVADALTRLRGPEAQRALAAVKGAMAGQPIKDADAALIGRLVGTGAGIGAYRATTTPLRPQ